MFRLIEHPDSEAITRHNVRRHYTQRLVMQAAVCRELSNAPEGSIIWRPEAALAMLNWWMGTVYELPESSWVNYAHGLDNPRLAEFASDLKPELEAGSRVCQALAMAFTADTEWELKGDLDTIRDRLDDYLAVAGAAEENDRDQTPGRGK